MVSMDPAMAEGLVDVHGLYCHHGPCWGLWHVLMQETMLKTMIHDPDDCKGKEATFAMVLKPAD